MTERIVLAYSGSLVSSAAVAWLRERHRAEVVTVTLDVGQADHLDAVRARALACGAQRAHVVDARDRFARDCALPALQAVPAAAPLAALADPLIAKTLVEVAAIETADAVAHTGHPGGRGAALSAQVSAVAPSLRIIAPAGEWDMDAARLAAYARARGLPVVVDGPESNLLIRCVVDPARAPAAAAHLDIALVGGVPVAINGVPMALPELFESVSLIGGQYGLGHGDAVPSPAAVILRAAYGLVQAPDQSVRVTLERGSCRVAATHDHDSQLVSHP